MNLSIVSQLSVSQKNILPLVLYLVSLLLFSIVLQSILLLDQTQGSRFKDL